MGLTYDECEYDDPLHPKHAIIDAVYASDDRTILQSDMGKLIVGTKAGSAITFTLPTPTVDWENQHITFLQTIDQNMVIEAATNDLIIALGNAAADTVTFSTASEKIGAVCELVCKDVSGTYYWIVIRTVGTATIAG